MIFKRPFSVVTAPVDGAASRAGEVSRAAATEAAARWVVAWAAAWAEAAAEAGAVGAVAGRHRTRTRPGEGDLSF